jgi:hypothetical protein
MCTRGVLTGDFNGDGKPDVAVARNGEGTFSSIVSIFLGNGAGGLGPQTTFAAGEGANGLAAGSFNGDGALDLVTANNRSNDVSILLNNCPVGPIDLRPTAIEVTQSIQDLNNSVVLVEGKRTFARVHVGTNVDLTRMTARLYGYDANGAPLGSPLWPTNPGAVIDPSTTASRGNINDSFLFELPPSWTTGDVTLKAEVNPNQTVSEGDYANNITSTSVTFQPTRALKLRLVKYQYYETDGSFHAPTDADLNAVESRLRREFPISKLSISRTTFTDEERFSPQPITPAQLKADRFDMWDRLREWHQNYEPSNTGVAYLGIVDRGIGGLAEVPGWNAVAGDAESATHEVSHLMGRQHIRCSGDEGEVDPYPYEGGKIGGPAGDTARFYGFDAGDASLLRPLLPNVISNGTGEEMGYCHPHWLSDLNYTAIRNYIQQNFSAVDPEGDFLSIYGTIDFGAQDASLLVSRVPRVSEIPPLKPGPYSIRLFDAGGTRLAEHRFTSTRVHVEPSGEEAGMIAQVVNFAPGTRRVAVYSEEAGREIGSVTVSANAPSVSNVAAQLPSAGGPIQLSWNSSDPDGDQLRSTILYSDDGGTEWQTIASGVKSETYSVDPSELPGTGGVADGLLRVIVDDGVLTAQAKTEPLIVPGKPPEARITAPLTGATYMVGQSTNFEGVGEDVEDGTLEDAKLSWNSDLDGPLGTGRLHAERLSKGTHRVTLTATDSDGQTDTATITVNVVAGYENPEPDDSTPPTVDCAAPDGLWHTTDVVIVCTASDAGSGLANPSDASFSLETSIAAGTEDADATTASRNVCDKAVNCATAGPVTGNKVDKQAPGIAISAPADGASYFLRDAVTADYTCTDGGSGVTSCSGTAPNGGHIDTLTLGSKVFQVDTADALGNKDSKSVNYEVIYNFSGFFSPVDNPDVLNQAKAGSAIPVKFGLGSNQGLDIFAKAADGSSYPKSAAMSCDSTDPVDDIEQTVTANASGLTYDATTDRYTYVWKTSKEWRGCRQLVMKLNDGSFHRANFKFTK